LPIIQFRKRDAFGVLVKLVVVVGFSHGWVFFTFQSPEQSIPRGWFLDWHSGMGGKGLPGWGWQGEDGEK
jgi:hypothetical protein